MIIIEDVGVGGRLVISEVAFVGEGEGLDWEAGWAGEEERAGGKSTSTGVVVQVVVAGAGGTGPNGLLGICRISCRL